MYFSLENGLAVNNYARIIWPYNLGYTNVYAKRGTWGVVSAKCADPDIIYDAEIRRSAIGAESGSFVYYVKFVDGNGAFRELLAN